MNYLNILDCDIADGEGIRVTLFVSGCSHHCKGCQNPESWNPKAGKPFNEEDKEKLFNLLSRDYVNGLTLSGGDPLYVNNRECVAQLCKEFKKKFPNKTIWLYTGYTYEEIKDLDVIKYIDVIVDGEFQIDKRDITLEFRGSSNQNIIRRR
jgi:anaerobic ribonucleoside-triphosphate reductase activating protein